MSLYLGQVEGITSRGPGWHAQSSSSCLSSSELPSPVICCHPGSSSTLLQIMLNISGNKATGGGHKRRDFWTLCPRRILQPAGRELPTHSGHWQEFHKSFPM